MLPYIKQLAAERVNQPVDTEESLLLYLRRWWCTRYKRPFKDPLLDEYTITELALEFYEVFFTDNPEKLKKYLEEGDKDEADEEAEDEAWMEQQMRQAAKRTAEKEAAKKKPPPKPEPEDADGQSIDFGSL